MAYKSTKSKNPVKITGKNKTAVKKMNSKQQSEILETRTPSFVFPRKLLEPVGKFLNEQLKKFENRKSVLVKDDPFSSSRGDENYASPDTNASEQFGHARTEALRAELDKRIIQMRKALARVKIGSYGICETCSKMIDTDRLVIFPEATHCISCEKKLEKK